MNMKMSKYKIELVLASDEEEFFYEDSDEAVAEGDPVGLDVEVGDLVELRLFDNIYHEFK